MLRRTRPIAAAGAALLCAGFTPGLAHKDIGVVDESAAITSNDEGYYVIGVKFDDHAQYLIQRHHAPLTGKLEQGAYAIEPVDTSTPNEFNGCPGS